MAKKKREINFKPNFLFYFMWYKLGIAKNRLNPELATKEHPNGQKVTPVFVNLGGTRSSKTFDEVHMIFKVFTDMPNANLRAIVYRETLVTCRKYTLIDFKDCLNLMKLENGVDYELTGEISGTPQIKIKGNVIDFMGYPEKGKQAGKCHIAFINEILDSDNHESVDNILQRCTLFAMIDANPAKTDHFIYNRKNWFNWFYSNTTYLDNDHLPEGAAGKYESKCPWDYRDSKIMVYDYIPTMPAGWVKDEKGEKLFFNGFRRRVWTKEECPENYLDQPYPDNKYRAPNIANVERGTVDKFWWLTMGEGIITMREGSVFKFKKISEFPYNECDRVQFGLDFGYSSDPSALTMVGANYKKRDLYIKLWKYQKTPDVFILLDLIEPILRLEEERRIKEAEGNEHEGIIVCCDSSDKFKDVYFVRNLQEICRAKDYPYEFIKIKKPHIVVRISNMKKWNIYLVDDEGENLSREFTNYVYQRNDKGEPTNMIEEGQSDHAIDSANYAEWYFFRHITENWIDDDSELG